MTAFIALSFACGVLELAFVAQIARLSPNVGRVLTCKARKTLLQSSCVRKVASAAWSADTSTFTRCKMTPFAREAQKSFQ